MRRPYQWFNYKLKYLRKHIGGNNNNLVSLRSSGINNRNDNNNNINSINNRNSNNNINNINSINNRNNNNVMFIHLSDSNKYSITNTCKIVDDSSSISFKKEIYIAIMTHYQLLFYNNINSFSNINSNSCNSLSLDQYFTSIIQVLKRPSSIRKLNNNQNS
ncbi:hypothetical protein ACTA71_000169 [Dictyostelium dimigraforme]